MPSDLSGGIIPTAYRDLFEMINSHGLEKLTFTIFSPLFESKTLTKAILNQIWYTVTHSNSIGSRADFYKCLALMAIVQQGKAIDEKLLDNYVKQELPIPTLDSVTNLEDRLIRLLRNDQKKTTLCFRYNDLCLLDTIQVDKVPEKKGIIIRHVEYDITSMRLRNKVSRRYNDFFVLHELLTSKYPYRIIPILPPKKTVNVDSEFLEERRRSLQRYLQILCRHPTIYDTDIIKFFLTFQGTSCGDNMKATYKNDLDEYNSESRSSSNSIDNNEKSPEDSDGIQMFHTSQTHILFLHQHLNQIRGYLKSINEKTFKNANDFSNIEKALQTLGSDSTNVDRWATGPNDYWPTIQTGLGSLPIEVNAISQRMNEQFKRDDQVISDHLDMLVDLLQGYKDLCKRFEEALQNEKKAIHKANNQQQRSSTATSTSSKNDTNLDTIEKRNRHALQCVHIETQLVYANLEAFVYILSSFANSQCNGSLDLANIWKAFANKVSQLGQTYTTKSPIDRLRK
ncbi:unnamed protein product [Rotaria magnacalcarata]|uniref:Sorting nexin 8 n=1 Tax=Rotaria magnacalcarata TaxID=392030 RepID=A0A816VBG7_9BILA|nr:unnamed protein product [Rotaria magnacalcarata]CAF2129137.1 unnamed protein product [Rotaria magnacalcarata]